MGADLNCLMGEIIKDPEQTNTNSEELLIGLLHALLREQISARTTIDSEVDSDSSYSS